MGVKTQPTHGTPDVPSGGVSVLVVDDNRDAVTLLARLLEIEGHRPIVALDPLHALEQARNTVVDLAVLDIGLPVMDGYELAARLRAELGARCPPLVALTGYGQESDRQRSREAGFAAHLVKPVDARVFFGVIEQLTRSGGPDAG